MENFKRGKKEKGLSLKVDSKKFTEDKNTFLREIGLLIKKYWKKDKIKNQKYKEIRKKLSFEENELYGDLMTKTQRQSSFFWLIFPFQATFYMVIFGLVVLVGFDMNLLEPFKIIVSILFKFYPLWIFIFLIEVFFQEYYQSKRSKRILDYLNI